MSWLSGHYDVIINRLWRHQQNENRAIQTRGRCVEIISSSFMDSLCRVRNKIMYVLLRGKKMCVLQWHLAVHWPRLFSSRSNMHTVYQFKMMVSLFDIHGRSMDSSPIGFGTPQGIDCQLYMAFYYFGTSYVNYTISFFPQEKRTLYIAKIDKKYSIYSILFGVSYANLYNVLLPQGEWVWPSLSFLCTQYLMYRRMYFS